MTLNLQEVARAIGADSHLPPLEVTGWSVDTRTQNPGDVYFALRGPNHDGHDFLAAAAEKGASAVVVESSGIRPSPVQVGQALSPANPPGGSELRSDWQAEACPTELLVPDTERALQDLAAWARQKWGGRIVAVTGSAGKTTTKDAI